MFPNPVLASAAFIHDNSQHVSVPNVSRAAKEVCGSSQLSSHAVLFVLGIHFFCARTQIYAKMKAQKYSTATWKTPPLHPKAANEAAVNW